MMITSQSAGSDLRRIRQEVLDAIKPYFEGHDDHEFNFDDEYVITAYDDDSDCIIYCNKDSVTMGYNGNESELNYEDFDTKALVWILEQFENNAGDWTDKYGEIVLQLTRKEPAQN